MDFRYVSSLALLLPLAFNASCTPRESKPTFSGKKPGQSRDGTPGTSTPSGANKEKSTLPTQIQLVNTKFSGQENKLEAQVTLAGVTSPRVKLTPGTGLASASVPGLPVNDKDTMIVHLYEGAAIRFIAFRPNTLVEKGKANSLKLEDCALTKAPWDGESNQGACGWSVVESK